MKNSIRLATIQDLEQLEILWSKYQEFYKVTVIDHEKNFKFISNIILNNDLGAIHVYEEKGSLLGFTTIYYSFASTICERVGILNDLFVLVDHRRKGIARALLNNAKKFTLSKNINYLRWNTQESNSNAQKLYKNYAQPSSWLVYSINLKG